MQEQLKARIQALDEKIKALNEERNLLRQQYAEGQTDFKVGDRVKNDESAVVWQLSAIRPGFGDAPKFFGHKIKKDGTPGLVISEIWTGYKQSLVKANV